MVEKHIKAIKFYLSKREMEVIDSFEYEDFYVFVVEIDDDTIGIIIARTIENEFEEPFERAIYEAITFKWICSSDYYDGVKSIRMDDIQMLVSNDNKRGFIRHEQNVY